MKFSISIILFLLVGFNPVLFAQQDGMSFVRKNLQLRGGDELMKSLKGLKVTGKIKSDNVELPFVYYWKSPSKIRVQMEIKGADGITVINGDSGWTMDPTSKNNAPEKLSGANLKQMIELTKHIFLFYDDYLFDTTAGKFKAIFEGTDSIGNNEVTRVRISIEGFNDCFYYFDNKTGMDLRHEYEIGNTKDFMVIDLQDVYSLKGLIFPRVIESKPGKYANRTTKIVAENININPVLDDSLFDFPKNENKK